MSVFSEILAVVEARYPETLAYCIIIHGVYMFYVIDLSINFFFLFYSDK